MTSELAFKISRKSFLTAILQVEGVVSSYDTVPVLQTYHLELKDTRLRIAATDMELGVTVSTTVNVGGQGGDIAIPAHKLTEIVKSVKADSEISLTVKDKVVSINSSRTGWRLRSISGSEFPELPQFADEGQVWVIKRLELLAILERLQGFLAPESEISVGLKSIAVGPKRIMATNAKILMVQTCASETGSVKQIPGSCVKDLIAVLRLSTAEEISLIEGDEFLFIDIGGDVFFTRLFDNWTFPGVDALLNSVKESRCSCRLSGKAFAAAIRRVKVTSDTKNKEIQVKFGTDKLTLNTGETEGDFATESLEYAFSGHGLGECVVAWEFLLKAVELMPGPVIDLKLCVKGLVVQDRGIYLTGFILRCDY